MTRCRICDKEYVPYQSILGDHEGLCQECEGSVLETIAEWELEDDSRIQTMAEDNQTEQRTSSGNRED